jgi:uncharacterized repeat protein (TIGR03803 family)
MLQIKFSPSRIVTLALIVATALLVSSSAGAQQEMVLHSFNGPGDAGLPAGGLVMDKAGNLYGMSTFGGEYGVGAVYELSAHGNEHVLYSFNPNVGDGGEPEGSLIFDDHGNLYGATNAGGSGLSGTVFELTPQGGGLWSERILHSFKPNPPDGYQPYAGLVFDKAGNLYGTTSEGGSGPCSHGCGVVYELSPKAGGVWAAKVIYSFNGFPTDGQTPAASLVVDAAGNLYGTTVAGGTVSQYQSGTVFELSPNGSGGWTEKILHSFSATGTEGYNLDGSVALDSTGNIYSTTNSGGSYGYGTLFELSPSAGGWTETILHNFGAAGDGRTPESGVIFDASGNLYGTVSVDGDNSKGPNYGSVYEMSPSADGIWNESILFSFDGNDGYAPNFGVILDSQGNLYGTTEYGGVYSSGTVFEIVK